MVKEKTTTLGHINSYLQLHSNMLGYISSYQVQTPSLCDIPGSSSPAPSSKMSRREKRPTAGFYSQMFDLKPGSAIFQTPIISLIFIYKGGGGKWPLLCHRATAVIKWRNIHQMLGTEPDTRYDTGDNHYVALLLLVLSCYVFQSQKIKAKAKVNNLKNHTILWSWFTLNGLVLFPWKI